jgi:hypothetical protein
MSSKGGPIITLQGVASKPKGFFEAISLIERCHELESSGGEIPAGMFTTQNKIEFWEAGFISSLWSGFLTVAFTPLAIGVIERLIPVFGGDEAKAFDQVLVFFLAVSFTLGFAAFLGRLGRFYEGMYTKTMIRSFLGGVTIGAVLKVFFSFILFHFLALYVSEPARLGNFILLAAGWISPARLESAYYFLLNFRRIYLISAWFILITTISYLSVPFASIGLRIWRDRKTRKRGGIRL